MIILTNIETLEKNGWTLDPESDDLIKIAKEFKAIELKEDRPNEKK